MSWGWVDLSIPWHFSLDSRGSTNLFWNTWTTAYVSRSSTRESWWWHICHWSHQSHHHISAWSRWARWYNCLGNRIRHQYWSNWMWDKNNIILLLAVVACQNMRNKIWLISRKSKKNIGSLFKKLLPVWLIVVEAKLKEATKSTPNSNFMMLMICLWFLVFYGRGSHEKRLDCPL